MCSTPMTLWKSFSIWFDLFFSDWLLVQQDCPMPIAHIAQELYLFHKKGGCRLDKICKLNKIFKCQNSYTHPIRVFFYFQPATCLLSHNQQNTIESILRTLRSVFLTNQENTNRPGVLPLHWLIFWTVLMAINYQGRSRFPCCFLLAFVMEQKYG